MGISEAKRYIGQVCAVSWHDRSGTVMAAVSKVHDVTYVPLYGGYLVTDTEDIPLEKLTLLVPCGDAKEALLAAR